MDITVVIPTYNRSAILRVCLQRLEAQSVKDFEVVVVNDGSTDDTEAVLAEAQSRSSLQIRRLKQENGGPARGRNAALAHVQTRFCILIGDDILVSEHFIKRHLDLHRNNPDKAVVGLGWTHWDSELQRLTPFMRWLEDVQFEYAKLLAGATPTWQHFYTSNLSFKTDLLREARFDERFRKAAFEDLELGYRLARSKQLELVFLREALATHVHPMTLLDAARRMQAVGYSEHQMNEYWPATKAPASSAWKQMIINGLAAYPRMLQELTRSVARVRGEARPNKAIVGLLLAHHKFGYLEYAKDQQASSAMTPQE